MSGGVDSSAAAAVLKEQGHDVTGIGLKLAPSPEGTQAERGCCGIAAMDDARRVAAGIGIPFYVLDYQEVFQNAVIDYFCREYLDGRTPNPCVVCNHAIKFGRLLERAGAFGASHVATGHYARVCRDERTGRFLLKKGTDRARDQSYFLYGLTQEQLARTMFPLGAMTKEETRELAQSFGLKVHDKPGSQDICFVGDEGYRGFLTKRIPDAFQPGPIVNRRGEVLGEHRGVACYTAGQRKGLGIAASEPLYVLAVDASARRVVVGTRDEMLRRQISVGQINWIAPIERNGPLELNVKTRYRQPERPAIVSCSGNSDAEVTFTEPQMAAAPGQSAVFYDGDVVVGGGIVQQESEGK